MLEGTEQFSKSSQRTALFWGKECSVRGGSDVSRMQRDTGGKVKHGDSSSLRLQQQKAKAAGESGRQAQSVTCSSSPEAQVRGHCFLAKVTSRCHVSILDQTRREPVILTRTKTLKMQFP